MSNLENSPVQPTKITISALALVDEQILPVAIAANWYQEDIGLLAQQIFSALEDVQLVEHVIGADRENFRFRWQTIGYSLSFECYSASCWIETDHLIDAPLLAMIRQALLTNSGKQTRPHEHS